MTPQPATTELGELLRELDERTAFMVREELDPIGYDLLYRSATALRELRADRERLDWLDQAVCVFENRDYEKERNVFVQGTAIEILFHLPAVVVVDLRTAIDAARRSGEGSEVQDGG